MCFPGEAMFAFNHLTIFTDEKAHSITLTMISPEKWGEGGG